MPSKVAIDPEDPSLGRIRVDSIAPPHSPASIKRCISRVERTPALAHADLFADISCDNPLKEGHISILRTDGPGLSPTNEPMAIVQMPECPIPDGKYLIKNRAADIYWTAGFNPTTVVHFWYFWSTTMKTAKSSLSSQVNKHCPIIQVFVKDNSLLQWHITHDTNGNIFMTSLYAPPSWVGAEMTESTVPVSWRLIPADGKSY